MKSRWRRIPVRAAQEVKKEFVHLFSGSRPRKIVFDHLHKCGGSSLNVYLESNYPRRKTFSVKVDHFGDPGADLARFKSLPESVRHSFELVKGHYASELFAYVDPNSLKVTMLREPVDRIVSHYYYVKSRPIHNLHVNIGEQGMDLEEYVATAVSPELRNWYTVHFSGLTLEDAEAAPDDAVERALQVLLNDYDIVGFLESFSDFTDRLRSEGNLRYEYQGRKENVSPQRVGVDEVSETARQTIARMNALDIALYRKLTEALG